MKDKTQIIKIEHKNLTYKTHEVKTIKQNFIIDIRKQIVSPEKALGKHLSSASLPASATEDCCRRRCSHRHTPLYSLTNTKLQLCLLLRFLMSKNSLNY